MLTLLLAATLAATPPPEADLEALAAALRGKAWTAHFEQRYVPAGFDDAPAEHGEVIVAPPAGLRFEYLGESPRIFATDGIVARLVDPQARTCDALNLDSTTWGRMPIAVLMDPGAARTLFVARAEGGMLHLTPRQGSAELAEILISLTADRLPASVTVIDGGGNQNRLVFRDWRAIRPPAAELFRPSLDGGPPCAPADG